MWDLVKLGDYLGEREDVDPCRVGITGESLGGAADDRCQLYSSPILITDSIIKY